MTTPARDAGVLAALSKVAKLKAGVKLQPHQQQAVDRAGSGRGQALNWGLGSGKTLGAIAVAEKRGGNVLVVTPASLRTNFDKQLRQFVTPDRVSAYTVVSYEKFRRDPHGVVGRVRPNTLIADEFHRLRNTKPRVPFDAVRDSVPFVLGLTGSIINNRPEELAPLTNLVAGRKVFDSTESFKRDHITVTKVSPGLMGRLRGVQPGSVESIKNPAALSRKLAPHIHRFTGTPEYKKHVPRVVEESVRVQMTPQQESLYKSLSTRNPALAYKLRNNLPPSKKDLREMNAFMTAARQIMNNPSEYTVKDKPHVITGSPKFSAQIREIEDGVKKDKNFRAVIYSNFLSSGVTPVVDELNKRGVKAKAFTGALNDKQRQALVDDLNKGRIQVLGMSPAGGEGLDLKGVRVVQLTEEHWNPERGAQAIGRSARFKSHAHLPDEHRRVDVRRFQAIHRPTLMNKIFGTKRPMSADEWIDKRRLEKTELNQSFLRVIKE